MVQQFRSASIFILLVVLSAPGITSAAAGRTAPVDDRSKTGEIASIIRDNYITAVDSQKLSSPSIEEVVTHLDQYTTYLPPEKSRQENDSYDGAYGGVGVRLYPLRDTLCVIEVAPEGPAGKAGILPGDRFISLDGKSMLGFSPSHAVHALNGPQGTSVRMAVRRPGRAGEKVVAVTRGDVPLPSVDAWYMLNDSVGCVSINGFIWSTRDEVVAAMRRLRSSGMKSVVIDLRGNPGGFAHAAVEVADLFLDGGSSGNPRLIMHMEARNHKWDEVHYARTGDEFENTPLVVLVDSVTASASEIFAGAIQDWDRGIIVGSPTYGKGLVQRRWTLKDGSAIHVTIGRYNTPSGRVIQKACGVAGQHVERQAFRTGRGRIVFSGNGILPDSLATPYALAEPKILGNDILFPFVLSLLGDSAERIGSSYGSDYVRFGRLFSLPAGAPDAYRRRAEASGICCPDSLWQKDLPQITARIKAQLAQSFWGYQGWACAMKTFDPVLASGEHAVPAAGSALSADGPCAAGNP